MINEIFVCCIVTSISCSFCFTTSEHFFNHVLYFENIYSIYIILYIYIFNIINRWDGVGEELRLDYFTTITDQCLISNKHNFMLYLLPIIIL